MGAGFLVAFYCIGIAFNCISVFLNPLMDSIGVSNTVRSSITTFYQGGSMAILLVTGKLVKKFGTRKVIFVAGACLAAGYLILSISQTVVSCFAGMLVIGVGYGAGGIVPISVLLTNWFKDKKGFAIGVAMCGSGVATLFFPELLASWIRNFGLQKTFVFNAACIFAFVVIASILIRDYPSEKGLRAYGDNGETEEQISEQKKIALRESEKSSDFVNFIIMAIGIVLIGLILSPTVTHISPIVSQSGYGDQMAAIALSIYGAAMMIGKPLFGIIIDKIGPIKANIYVYILLMLSLIDGIVITKSPVFAYGFTLIFGVGAATMVTVGLPVWAAEIFGQEGMTKKFPWLKLCSSLGGTIGATIPGIIIDKTGSYSDLFKLYMIFGVLSFCLIEFLFIRKNRRKQ